MRIVATARYIDANPPGTQGNAITLDDKPEHLPQPTYSLLPGGWQERYLNSSVRRPLKLASLPPFKKIRRAVPEKTQASSSMPPCHQLPGVRDVFANELGMGNLATLVYAALTHETNDTNKFEMGDLAVTANSAILQETKRWNYKLGDKFEATRFQERDLEMPPAILTSIQVRRRDDWMNKPMREGNQ
jgi:hypothetical protein